MRESYLHILQLFTHVRGMHRCNLHTFTHALTIPDVELKSKVWPSSQVRENDKFV